MRQSKQAMIMHALEQHGPMTTSRIFKTIPTTSKLPHEDALKVALSGLKLDGLIATDGDLKWNLTDTGLYWLDNNPNPRKAQLKETATAEKNQHFKAIAQQLGTDPAQVEKDYTADFKLMPDEESKTKLNNIIMLAQTQIDSIAMSDAPPITPANTFIQIRDTALELIA